MKRILLLCLLGGALFANSGCGLLHAVCSYRPCVSRGDCSVGPCDECGDFCGPTCRSVRGPVVARRTVSCNDCCDSCDPCADPCGRGAYGRCWYRGPLSCVFALFMPHYWQGCGCSEQRYWGDFYSDPPDCWDPCDGCGNYTGGGYTGGALTPSSGGCRNCGSSASYRRGAAANRVEDGAMTSEMRVVSDRAVTTSVKSASEPRRAVRTTR